MDCDGLKSINGILKFVQLVLGLIFCCLEGIVCGNGKCVNVPVDHDAYRGLGFTLFVGAILIFFTLTVLMVHTLNICGLANDFFTTLVMIGCLVASVLYFIAWAVSASYADKFSPGKSSFFYQLVFGTIFGVAQMFVYAADGFFYFKAKQGGPAAPV